MLSKTTVKQLKTVAKGLKIKGYYKLRKNELIEKIEEIQSLQKKIEEELKEEMKEEPVVVENETNDFEEVDWEDEIWAEDSNENWDDMELTNDVVLKKQIEEEKTLVITEEIHCENYKCKAIFYNGFICPECNEINIDLFNKNLRNIKYGEAKKLLSNLREILEDSLKSLYNIEISMFIAPIKLNMIVKDECQCCFMEFDKKCDRVPMKCHGNFCEDCVKRWIMIKVRDNEVKPYIQCLSDECHHPLPYDILNKYMDKDLKEKFIKYFSYKTLIKYSFFKQLPGRYSF